MRQEKVNLSGDFQTAGIKFPLLLGESGTPG
jgi:hypothetical protein